MVSETVTGVNVGVGVGGSSVGAGVSVGIGVSVGKGVLVGGTGVSVGIGVSVGAVVGRGVFVGRGVLVGGTAVGGFWVLVGVAEGRIGLCVGARVGVGLGVLVEVAVGAIVGGAVGGGGTKLAKSLALSSTMYDINQTRAMFNPTESGAFLLNTAKMVFCSARMPSSWAAKSYAKNLSWSETSMIISRVLLTCSS